MKRTRLQPMSKKRRNQLEARAHVREAVFRRDDYRCQLAGHGICFGVLTPHHILKASQGGPYSVENLTSLCALHNDRLEGDADLARVAVELGLVVRRAA